MIGPKSLKSAIRASAIYWPLMDAHTAWREMLWRRTCDRWIRIQRRQKTYIHLSLEFTGKRPPFHYLAIGPECYFERNVTIWCAPDEEARPQLSTQSHVYLGHNIYIGVYDPISIGHHVMIGAFSYLTSCNHTFERRDIPMAVQPFRGGPIVIEDDVWIGTHAVILPGVTIGRGAVVGAGSLVNKDIPPFEIWGGVPARFLKQRP